MVLAATLDPAFDVAEAGSPKPLAVRLVTGASAIGDHLVAWCKLAERGGSTAFQTADFVEAWARSFEESPTLVLVEHGTALAGLLAVEIDGGRAMRIARLAGAPVGQYDDMLVDPSFDPASVFEAACRALRQQLGVDALLLSRVRQDSVLSRACHGGLTLGPPDLARAAEFGGRDADAYLATRKKRVRQQLAKRRRQLEAIGPLDFSQAGDPAEAADWMSEALRLKRDWLRETGRVSRAFADPRTAAFLVDAARVGTGSPAGTAGAGGCRLVVSRLTVGGRLAAVEAGFVSGDSYHLYLGAFAPEFGRFSAGNILTEAVIRRCIADGIRRYDMLAPDSRNKREWANRSTAVSDLALPLSPRGRLYLQVVHRTVMPAARGLFYLLPLPFRSFVATRILAL